MKCAACGYEFRDDPKITKRDVDILTKIGMPPFIEIQSVYMPPFKKTTKMHPGTDIPVVKYQGVKVTMYACPKCKTVRLGN